MEFKKIDLLEKKMDRIQGDISGRQLTHRSDEIEDSLEVALTQLSEELTNTKQLRNNSRDLENKQRIQKVNSQIYRKLKNIDMILKFGIEGHIHLIELSARQSNEYEIFDQVENLVYFLKEQLGVESEPVLVFKDYFLSHDIQIPGYNSIPGTIISCPFYEKENVLMYPMLAHEVAHTFINENHEEIFDKFKDEFIEVKREKEQNAERNPNITPQINEFHDKWDKWKEEFAADVVAAKILGEGYYYTLVYYLMKGNPYRAESDTHPPPVMRLEAVAKALDLEENEEASSYFENFDATSRYNRLAAESLLDPIIEGVEETLDVATDGGRSAEQLEEDLRGANPDVQEEDLYNIFTASWNLFHDEFPTSRLNQQVLQAL
jgi:hypothetical protein